MTDRATAPVFVVGSPRSGTTLLYHMLLSAGGFAYYRTESYFFSQLALRVGNLHAPGAPDELAKRWLRSDMHRASGLHARDVAGVIRDGCNSAGAFFNRIMQLTAERQGRTRWAENTPEHVLYIPEIKRDIPDALFLHIIRDGRDVAVSLAKWAWITPLPWDLTAPERAAGAYWSWVVENGRRLGAGFPGDYMEVSYEDLVGEPQKTLDRVGSFIGQDLDYASILRAGIGSVRRPQTSFPEKNHAFSGRWREVLEADRAMALEELVAPTLMTLGYPVANAQSARPGLSTRFSRQAYGAYFDLKFFLRRKTRIGRRLVSLAHFEPGAMSIEEESIRELEARQAGR